MTIRTFDVKRRAKILSNMRIMCVSIRTAVFSLSVRTYSCIFFIIIKFIQTCIVTKTLVFVAFTNEFIIITVRRTSYFIRLAGTERTRCEKYVKSWPTVEVSESFYNQTKCTCITFLHVFRLFLETSTSA